MNHLRTLGMALFKPVSPLSLIPLFAVALVMVLLVAWSELS